jgi:hypothetical protein
MQGGTQHLDTKLKLSQSQHFDFEYKDTKTHTTFVDNKRNTQRNKFEQLLAWKTIQTGLLDKLNILVMRKIISTCDCGCIFKWLG